MLAKILNLSNMKVDEEVDEEFIGSLQKKKFFYHYSVEVIS
jgi:hypothetical protein